MAIKMNTAKQIWNNYQKAITIGAILFLCNALSIHPVVAQCDSSSIDPCEVGKNNIIQASYHAQIIKTSNGYSVTGQNLTPEGISYLDVLTNIPSTLYPMPDGVFPVWGALGGRTQAVFLGSDSKIYAVGTQDLLIDEVHSNGTAWGATNLELPENLTVCEVNKWEGTAGSCLLYTSPSPRDRG